MVWLGMSETNPPVADNDSLQVALEDMPDAHGWVDGYMVGPATDSPSQVGEGQWSGDFEISRIKVLPIARLNGAASFTPWQRSARVQDLARKIKESGTISPVIVDDEGDIMEGQHRLEAAIILGLAFIPGVVLAPNLQTRFLDERNIMHHALKDLSDEEREALQADFQVWQAMRRARRVVPARRRRRGPATGVRRHAPPAD